MLESDNGPADEVSIAGEARHQSRRWMWVAIIFVLMVGLAYGSVFLLADLFAKPTAKSVDEIDTANLASMSVLAINRPDGGPDISAGGKEMLPVPADQFSKLLAPLKNSRQVTTDRGIYLGEVRMIFKNGSKLTIMLHRAESEGRNVLRLGIEQYQYDADSLEPFLKVLDQIDDIVKGRR